MTIPFRVKLLTPTAKAPTQENAGDLWDLYVDNFDSTNLKDLTGYGEKNGFPDYLNYFSDQGINHSIYEDEEMCLNAILFPKGRILVKTGIAVELPKYCWHEYPKNSVNYHLNQSNPPLDWIFNDSKKYAVKKYAVADIRPRSGLALKHGITVLNSPATIDNSYRKEIGIILYNAGHELYIIKQGDKIAQMLIRPLYPSKMEIVENIEDTGRGGYGSTGQ